VRAYILVQTNVGSAAAVTKEIRGFEGVVASEHVAGPYDVVVEAEGRSLEDLSSRVLRRVQAIGDVMRTITCPILRR
jgi:DNA-binding Lrp family transcriptional regulator